MFDFEKRMEERRIARNAEIAANLARNIAINNACRDLAEGANLALRSKGMQPNVSTHNQSVTIAAGLNNLHIVARSPTTFSVQYDLERFHDDPECQDLGEVQVMDAVLDWPEKIKSDIAVAAMR